MNVTSENPTASPAVVVIRTLFIAVNALAVILANVLNIVILRRAQVGSEPARIFISSLALADILVGAVAFASIVPSGHDGFPFSDQLCQIVGSIFAVGLMLSMLFLAVISVDRYIAVVMALRYESLVTRERAIVTVILSWLAMVGLVVVVVALRPDVMNYNHSTFFCEPSFEDPNFPVTLFVAIMAWILTCSMVMMATYSQLFVVAHHHSRRIAAQELAVSTAQGPAADRPHRSVITRKELKAVWMCLTVTLAFNLAWVPTLTLDLYKFITKSNAAPGAEFAITWLSLSNSWWNFLIYSGMNKQFRNATKQLAKLACGKCTRSREEGPPRGLNLSVRESRRGEQSGQSIDRQRDE